MKTLKTDIPNLPSKPLKTLALVLTVVLSILIVYTHWADLISSTVEWQKLLHTMLAEHISAVSEDPLKYGSALILLSLGYGIFHAVGPGHGKAVIVTYLGTNRESLAKGIAISFLAAMLQSLIAIALVAALAKALSLRLAEAHNYGNDMALVSYLLVGVLGLLLTGSSIRRIIRSGDETSPVNGEQVSDSSLQHDEMSEQVHAHTHSASCSCNHAYVPEQNNSTWQTITVIFSMGFRPCSGAIVVLIYAHLVGVFGYGILATLMMGLGTGLSVSLIAAGTLYARSWLESIAFNSQQTDASASLKFSNYLRLTGGLILLALGWSLFSTASAVSSGHPLF